MDANSCWILLFLVSRPWAVGLLVCVRYIFGCMRLTSRMDQMLYRKSSILPYPGRFGEINVLKFHGISINLTNV